MGGKSRTTSQTSTVNLTPEQKELLKLALPPVKEYAAQPTTLPSTPLTAGFTPEQTAGQEQALGVVPTQQALAESGAGSTDFLLNQALFPETNPALRQTIEAATRPIQENLLTSTLPAIRSGAAATGGFGGSRQGIAEGLASRSASQAIGDTAAKVATEGYQGGLDAMVRSLGLLPQTIGAQAAPALTTSGVGDVRQNLQQQQLDEAAYRDLYAQLEPLYRGQNIAGVAAGLPGGSTTVTGTQPGTSPLTSALGGFSLGSALFPALSAAGPIGAGLGALLAFL